MRAVAQFLLKICACVAKRCRWPKQNRTLCEIALARAKLRALLRFSAPVVARQVIQNSAANSGTGISADVWLNCVGLTVCHILRVLSNTLFFDLHLHIFWGLNTYLCTFEVPGSIYNHAPAIEAETWNLIPISNMSSIPLFHWNDRKQFKVKPMPQPLIERRTNRPPSLSNSSLFDVHRSLWIQEFVDGLEHDGFKAPTGYLWFASQILRAIVVQRDQKTSVEEPYVDIKGADFADSRVENLRVS